MKLPKELTTVTPLSKTLALILFITLPIITFCLGIRYGQINSYTVNPTPYPTIVYLKTTPTPTKILKKTAPTKYTCPENGWVDCMPGTQPRPLCNQAFFDWAKANCPGFKGGAY